MKKRNIILTFVCVIVSILFVLSPAMAKYPDKPIILTVSYAPGGSTDVAARTMVPFLEKYLGGTVIVKNYPGAGGQVGWTKLARSKADGYTIGYINLPALNMVYTARKGVAYHPVKSFDPIGCNIIDPNTVLVRKDDARFKTIQDLVEAARKNPGKIVCSADGPLSDDQLAFVRMQKETGVKFGFVSYSGSAKSQAALLGGHSDFTISNTFDVIKYKDTERCLVQFWNERYPMNPDTPTFKEAFGKELIGTSTRAVAAPAGVPADRLNALREAFKKMANDPQYLAKAKKIGLTLAWMDHNQLGAYLKELQGTVESFIDELK